MVDFAVCYSMMDSEMENSTALPTEYLLDIINAFFAMNTSNETERKRKGLESGVPVSYHHLTPTKSGTKSAKSEEAGNRQKDKKTGDGRAESA